MVKAKSKKKKEVVEPKGYEVLDFFSLFEEGSGYLMHVGNVNNTTISNKSNIVNNNTASEINTSNKSNKSNKSNNVNNKDVNKSNKVKKINKSNKSNKSNDINNMDEDVLLIQENLPAMKDRYSTNISILELIKKTESSGNLLNTISSKNKRLLAKYSGWGGLSEKFKDSTASNSKLLELLEDNYSSAKSSTLTSFYTPLHIIKFMYKVIKKMGFGNGIILDPCAGTGRFISAMDEDMYYNSRITAIEPDNISYKITSSLLQEVNVIHSKYENHVIKDNSVDLIISNIPFGKLKVFDKIDKDLNEKNLSIHNYFFAKSIKKARVGGIIAFITSSSTLDSKSNQKFREEIADTCDFLGAVRLPTNAFEDTDVCTDIIFLQKTNKYNTKGHFEMVIEKDGFIMNEYFHNNLNMIVGEPTMTTNQFGDLMMISKSKDKKMKLDHLLKYFAYDIYRGSLDDSYMYEEHEKIQDTNSNIRQDEHILIEDKIYRKESYSLIPISYKGKRYEIYKDYIKLKDTLKDIVDVQANNFEAVRFNELLEKLNKYYDVFKKKYGYINSNTNKRILSRDIFYYNVSTLEVFNSSTNEYDKADIFRRRIVMEGKVEEPKNAEDAFLLSLYNLGKVNIDYICSLLKNVNKKNIIDELCEKDYIYYDPKNDKYIEKSLFLSGNVKDRLRKQTKWLNELLETNDNNLSSEEIKDKEYKIYHFKKNIKILEEYQPEYITDVFFELKSTWIPIKHKIDFISYILDMNPNSITLTHTNVLGYSLKFEHAPKFSVEADWSTPRRTSREILAATLNMKDITVVDKVDIDGKEKSIKNVEQTQLARNMQDKIKMEFMSYIKSDVDRYNELLDLYNELFNNEVEREYFNILNNLNIDPEISLREHQLKGASRIILSENNTLLAHSVGSGKTWTMTVAAQELSRISKISNNKRTKSLFVIPNSLCESGQFAKEYLTLYPQAKILATTPKDFEISNRRKIIAKIVTHDYDAIIIAHSTLIKIPLKPETEIEMIREDLGELDEIYQYYKEQGINYSIKKTEASMKNLETKLEKLNDAKRDEGLFYWEDLGITNIFIDEAHNFKNLDFPTKLQAAGITTTDAKKTKDLYNKIRYFRKKNGNKGIVFSTATPISNSMCELYTMQRYLMQEDLDEVGLSCFDNWASTFGQIETEIEIDVTGTKFKSRQRFSKFYNIPELITLFKRVADIVNIKDIQDIKGLPKLKDNKPTVVELKPTNLMKMEIDRLVERAKVVEGGNIDRSKDNMLMVVNDGRKLTVSPRLLGIDDDSIKINAAVKNLVELYNEDISNTHLVFCDLGTPKSKTKSKKKKDNTEDDSSNEWFEDDFDDSEDLNDYNVYEELKGKLIARGVEEKHIAFIHDGNTSVKRKMLIDKFNEGEIKILIGSTAKMGEGNNFQKHIKSLHHLSVPWRPSDIEQRVGRMIRQKNLNKEVIEFRYVIKNSFDAYSWQTIEIKSKYIEQIMNGDKSIRSIEDISYNSCSYAEAKACACGDDRILKLTKLQHEIKKLKTLEKGHNDQLIALNRRISKNKVSINSYKHELPKLKDDVMLAKEALANKDIISIDGVACNSKDMLIDLFKQVYAKDYEGVWGTVYGLNIFYDKYDKNIFIGNSPYLKITHKRYPGTLLNDILAVKKDIVNIYNRHLQRLKDLIRENDELKFKLNKKFEYKDRLEEITLEANKLQSDLLLNKDSQAV